MTKSYKITYTQTILGKKLDWLPTIQFCTIVGSFDNAKFIANSLLDVLNPGSTVFIDDGDNIETVFRMSYKENEDNGGLKDD